MIEPLFPGYIFVHTSRAEFEQIRYVTGVSSMVRFGDRIPSVPEETIDELRCCFESDEPMPVLTAFRPGAEVTVTEGPLAGLHGVIVQTMSARERVQILLEFLGRSALAEVDSKSLALEEESMADALPLLAKVA